MHKVMHKVMHFGSHNRQFTYHMKGKQLEEVNSEKNLGKEPGKEQCYLLASGYADHDIAVRLG